MPRRRRLPATDAITVATGRVGSEVAVGSAELRDDEQGVAAPAAKPGPERKLRAGARIVRRRVEVGDAALGAAPCHRGVVQAGAAERDVRHLEARAPERPVALHARSGPGGLLCGRLRRVVDEEELGAVLAPAGEGEAAGGGAAQKRPAAEVRVASLVVGYDLPRFTRRPHRGAG